ncbi:SGNH hydrolase [Mycena amicta]|nr:SGNH hydrolase [Mycena amicta]
MVYDAIVLFGDSITQAGWTDCAFGARLANAYSRKLDVLNRGLAGYNTDWALPVLEQCLEASAHGPKTRLIAVWFGANDACIKPSPQHVPLDKFVENIKKMVHLVQKADPSTKIILITPPPVNIQQREEDLATRDPPLAMDRSFEATEAYAKGVLEAGTDCDVPVADVWAALWNAAGKNQEGLRLYLSDGLHLTTAGYEIAYDALLETIRVFHSELDPERLEDVFPEWSLYCE